MNRQLRIGEAAREVGLSPKTIRYYERIGLIPPPERTETWFAGHGYRLFDDEDLRRLRFVRTAASWVSGSRRSGN